MSPTQQTPPQGEIMVNTPPSIPNPILGQAIQTIIQEITITKKNKWGVHAIRKKYLCQLQAPQGTIQQ
jgi:hypothetical protein